MKQGCILSPTPFSIFFSFLLSYPFSQSEDGLYLHTRSDGSLFSLTCLWAKTKCEEYYILGVVENFTYLGSTISSILSLDTKLNTQINKAVTAMAHLAKGVWENYMLTINTKMKVYQARVLSTLLYGSKAWTLYSCQECRLNAFKLHCLRSNLGITCQDCVPNKNILAQVGIPSIFTMLMQKHLHWLGHVSLIQDSWIPKDVLYGELATSSRPAGMPSLHFKDICKWDLNAGNINSAGSEAVAADHISCRLVIKEGIQLSEQRREDQWEVRRECRQQRAASATTELGSDYTCSNCNRACHSRIRLYRHSRHCSSIRLILGVYSIVFWHGRMPTTTTLAGMSGENMKRLQRIQKMSCHIVQCLWKYDHILRPMKDLHWLNVPQRIDFKLATLIFKCMGGTATLYLVDLVITLHNCSLRSTSLGLLPTMKCTNSMCHKGAFSSVDLRLLNSLARHIHGTNSI